MQELPKKKLKSLARIIFNREFVMFQHPHNIQKQTIGWFFSSEGHEKAHVLSQDSLLRSQVQLMCPFLQAERSGSTSRPTTLVAGAGRP